MINIRKGALDVYLLGMKVGRIDYSSKKNEMCFTYDTKYLESPECFALSHSLPLRSGPLDSPTTTVFFENLLPPDEVRRRLGPVLHISRHNIFGFLEALGGDCAGAISLWKEGAVPYETGKNRVRLTEEQAYEALKSLRKRPLYINGVDGYRISGSGAQDKLIVCLEGESVFLPLFGTPSTHILKPSARDYPDSVFNEYFSMTLAARLGLDVAQCGLVRLKGEAFYWTKRYDREDVDGVTTRLHQEDFCQILGISGELKYESEGGPSFKSCMAAMSGMGLSLADRLSFIDRMIFNYLIGNADAHGKNASVLYRGAQGRSLAPMYDVMSTAVYPNLSKTNAMYIGGAKGLGNTKRENFAFMAQEVGMRGALVLSRLDAMVSKIVPEACALAETLSDCWPSGIYEKILKVIRSQAGKVTNG